MSESESERKLREFYARPAPFTEKIASAIIHTICWILDKIVPVEQGEKQKP